MSMEILIRDHCLLDRDDKGKPQSRNLAIEMGIKNLDIVDTIVLYFVESHLFNSKH